MMNNLENKEQNNGLSNNFGNPFTPGGIGNTSFGGSNMGMPPRPTANPNGFNNPFGGAPSFGNNLNNNTPNPFAPNNMNSGVNPFANNTSNPFSNMGLNNQAPKPMNGPMPNTGANPFNTNPMFDKPMSSLSDADIDAMMKDIDRRLKELDEEEARQKAELEKKTQTSNSVVESKSPIANIGNEVAPVSESKDTIKGEVVSPSIEKEIEDIKPAEVEQKKEEKEQSKFIFEDIPKIDEQVINQQNSESSNKPKINVDADSIIVNENVITDDEFFDDFFNE